jgi:hypothetical protein
MSGIAALIADKMQPSSIELIGREEAWYDFEAVEAKDDGLVVRWRAVSYTKKPRPPLRRDAPDWLVTDEYEYKKRTTVTERFVPWSAISSVTWVGTAVTHDVSAIEYEAWQRGIPF